MIGIRAIAYIAIPTRQTLVLLDKRVMVPVNKYPKITPRGDIPISIPTNRFFLLEGA